MSGQGATPPGGTPPGVGADQSMEDILASIRRILNEDDAPSTEGAAADAAPGEAPAEPAGPLTAEEPLLLTEDMMVSSPEEPAPTAVQPEAEPVLEAPVAEAAPIPAPAPPREALLAPAVAAAAAASVGELLRAVSTERTAAVHRGGPTIEDVVREELRPMLKDWLDQHLPGLVERLVRVEIERVVGRALS